MTHPQPLTRKDSVEDLVTEGISEQMPGQTRLLIIRVSVSLCVSLSKSSLSIRNARSTSHALRSAVPCSIVKY